MLRAIAHQSFMVIALIVGATCTGLLAPALVNDRGTAGPLIFGSESVVAALAAVVACIVTATALGIVMARIANSAVGLFVLGGSLFGLAWRTASVTELARIAAESSAGGHPLLGACVEDLVWAVLLAAASLALFRFGGALPDIEPNEDGQVPSPCTSIDGWRAVAAGVAVLPVVWLVARTTSSGQLIGAAFLGGMVAGLAARLISPHVQPVLVTPAVLVAAAIGHAWVAFTVGAEFPDLVRAGTLPQLGRPMPIQYAAGAAMGVAMGLGWAKSFLHHEET